jgi:hypothetical protein
MLELGKLTDVSHKEAGMHAGEVTDVLVVVWTKSKENQRWSRRSWF